MEISLNGRSMTVQENALLSDVLKTLSVSPDEAGTAVAVNDEVIPRGRWASARIRSGDRVEIVRPVQGG